MKKSIIYKYGFLILLIGININFLASQTGNWKIVDTIPNFKAINLVTSSFQQLKCPDSLNCMSWADLGGAGGHYFRRTTDGGISWKTVYMDSAYFFDDVNQYLVPKILDIAYPNTKLFLAVGDSGLILRTTDKGETWQKINFGKEKHLVILRMLDDYYGILVGRYYDLNKPAYILYTSDGGLSWNNVNNIIGLTSINIINRNLLCGMTSYRENDTSIRSVIIWVHGNYETFDTLNRPGTGANMFFLNENNGWICGGYIVKDTLGGQSRAQVIHHTSDGGKTWETQRDTVFDGCGLHDIRFFDENFGMASGFFGLMLITTNGGKSWKEEFVRENIPNGLAFFMHEVQTPSPSVAYVIGDFEFIYKFTRDINEVKEVENTPADVLTVSPNPASQFSVINYQLPIEGKAKLSVFDMLSREVAVLLDEYKEAGRYNYELRITNYDFPAGIYFIKLSSGGMTQTQKFVIMR